MTPPAPAGLARRLGAALYELLLLVALLFVAGFALLPLLTPGPAGPGASLVIPAVPVRVFVFCALFAVGAGYFVWCWSNGRRTLPMKTWRLALVADDGGWPTLRRALARYLAAWIGPALALAAYAALRPTGLGAYALALLAFNFLWALIDRDRQFLHDRIAGTRVVAERLETRG